MENISIYHDKKNSLFLTHAPPPHPQKKSSFESL